MSDPAMRDRILGVAVTYVRMQKGHADCDKTNVLTDPEHLTYAIQRLQGLVRECSNPWGSGMAQEAQALLTELRTTPQPATEQAGCPLIETTAPISSSPTGPPVESPHVSPVFTRDILRDAVLGFARLRGDAMNRIAEEGSLESLTERGIGIADFNLLCQRYAKECRKP